MKMVKSCCVVGAGVAGLTAIKHCLDEGIQPKCYDKDDDIGGLWHFRDEYSDTDPSIYRSCSINTSKEMTCYSDFPIPKEFPNFMHHSHFKRYLDLYADHFELRKYIHLQTCVDRIERADNFEETGQWIVTTTDMKTGRTTREKFDFVMACNGHLTEPYRPSLPGLEKFKGQILHTHEYKDFRGFESKNILIIGIGNSAADVASELSRHAKHVYVSTRRGTYCIQRACDYGVPYDHVAITRFRQNIPHELMRPYHYSRLNYRYRHKNYSLASATNFESASVTISDDLPNRILMGAVTIHTDVKHFTEDGAVFVDGTEIKDIDVIILGTGYVWNFPFMEEGVIKQDGLFTYLYKLIWPVDNYPNTLAVIGLVQPFGPLPPVLEIQARWAAMVFAGKSKLPSGKKMSTEVDVWRDFVRKRYINAPKYSVQIYFIKYIDEIAEFIGCTPNFMKLFFTDIKLWYRTVFCAATPPQWRLMGPGKWSGAREAVMKVDEKTWYPMMTRKCGGQETVGLYDGWIKLFRRIAFLLFGLVLLKMFFSNGYHTSLVNY